MKSVQILEKTEIALLELARAKLETLKGNEHKALAEVIYHMEQRLEIIYELRAELEE